MSDNSNTSITNNSCTQSSSDSQYNTIILPVSIHSSDEQLIHDLSPAAQILKQGGIVAFPTETVYGLGGSMYTPVAISGCIVS